MEPFSNKLKENIDYFNNYEKEKIKTNLNVKYNYDIHNNKENKINKSK